MAHAANAVICPACHAQNRPNWEFCARCGEPLDSATTVAASRQPTFLAPAELGDRTRRDSSSFWLFAMVAVAVGTVILACRDIAAQPVATAPSPGVFTFGGPPPASPAPVPPPSVNGDVEQARRLIAQGSQAQAIPLLQKAVSENPGNSEFQHLLGRALWTTGSRDAALQSYFQAARLDPGAYRVEYAQALETAGRTDDAVAELEASLVAQPGNPAIEETLGRIYYNKGEYAKAGPLLDGVAAHTHDPVVLQQLAYAAEKSGDHDRAIATYRQVLDTQPRADVARGQLAESLLAAGRGNEAISVLQEGLQRTPEAPLLQRGLGSMLERSGRAAEAAAAYREYARLAPNAPDAGEITARAAQLEASHKGS